MPAARASWFALPATKEVNVNPGLRLVCSFRRADARRGRRGRRGGRVAHNRHARRSGRRGDFRLGGANGEGDRNAVTLGCGKLADPVGETLLDPLQHKAVRGDESVPVAHPLDRERPDPGVELLRGEFVAKRGEAALPEKRNRAHATDIGGTRRRGGMSRRTYWREGDSTPSATTYPQAGTEPPAPGCGRRRRQRTPATR